MTIGIQTQVAVQVAIALMGRLSIDGFRSQLGIIFDCAAKQQSVLGLDKPCGADGPRGLMQVCWWLQEPARHTANCCARFNWMQRRWPPW